MVEIPIYIVFTPYHVATKTYKAPFLRLFRLQKDLTYRFEELHEIAMEEGGTLDSQKLIDLTDILPFKVGLMKLRVFHEQTKELYRLIFVNPKNNEVLITSEKNNEKRAVKAEDQALKAKSTISQ
jgi:hypothetical protein